ncbi:MAG: hypothetical protein GY757_10010 [bacterium]|nr:hypothetical protein [bacterium]
MIEQLIKDVTYHYKGIMSIIELTYTGDIDGALRFVDDSGETYSLSHYQARDLFSSQLEARESLDDDLVFETSYNRSIMNALRAV